MKFCLSRLKAVITDFLLGPNIIAFIVQEIFQVFNFKRLNHLAWEILIMYESLTLNTFRNRYNSLEIMEIMF